MKNIAILGSTGSIGRQALEVAAANPDKVKVSVLAANTNDQELAEQINAFQPELAVLSDHKAAERLRKNYCGNTKILSGDEGLLAAATYEKTDTVLAAMVGFAGLKPTLAAIESGKNIALANKETLVAAGNIIMPAVAKNKVSLLPVDSEHSAIFQSLNGEDGRQVHKILLTASGGPFRGKKVDELENIALADCLKHPNWSMGQKITIDSSTLANKGLEVIEAHWLFGVSYDNIEVVVHPESVIHSMVEYSDGAVIAQLGLPDMRLPIQYAFSWPERWPADFGRMDFFKIGQLNFAKPDTETFPALQLAFAAGKAGGSMPAVYNAANEQAVYAFIDGKAKYLDIPRAIEYAMKKHRPVAGPSLPAIEEADREGRALALEYLSNAGE